MRITVIIFLLISIESCTIQKRIYRPGWTVHLKNQKIDKIRQEKSADLDQSNLDTLEFGFTEDTIYNPVYTSSENVIIDKKNVTVVPIKTGTLIERFENKTNKFIQQNEILEMELSNQLKEERPPIRGFWFFILSSALLIAGIAFISTADSDNLLIGLGLIVGSIALIPIGIGFMIIRYKWFSRNPTSRYAQKRKEKLDGKATYEYKKHQIAARILLVLGVLSLISASILIATLSAGYGYLLLLGSIVLIVVGLIFGMIVSTKRSRDKIEVNKDISSLDADGKVGHTFFDSRTNFNSTKINDHLILKSILDNGNNVERESKSSSKTLANVCFSLSVLFILAVVVLRFMLLTPLFLYIGIPLAVIGIIFFFLGRMFMYRHQVNAAVLNPDIPFPDGYHEKQAKKELKNKVKQVRKNSKLNDLSWLLFLIAGLILLFCVISAFVIANSGILIFIGFHLFFLLVFWAFIWRTNVTFSLMRNIYQNENTNKVTDKELNSLRLQKRRRLLSFFIPVFTTLFAGFVVLVFLALSNIF